ncbi:LysR substrate-binding domain-containing protein [Pseudaeromonas sharmana]|uniref:LysR substrate-binding domain-containing protein n=1 Tax=Pseudaeromonas sharmana TaxID=328412 RepID=A0ABV8CI92_9GAMM
MAILMHRLKALAVLDAVLSTGSFSAAAVSLCVTQSAISQHIKQLEQEVGLLFERHPRGLRPTCRAERMRPFLSQGLAQLEEGWRQLRSDAADNVVCLTVLPSFASCWLLPRLDAFNLAFPHIELRLSMSEQVQDLQASTLDLAIRFGPGDYPGLLVTPLMSDELFPVASPAFLASVGLPESPAALQHYALLRDNAPERMNWRAWFECAGVREFRGQHHLTLSDSAQLIRMAVAGRGVALARRALVAEELACGTLQRLFDIALPSPYAYYLVQTARSALRPAVRAFADWLLSQVADRAGAIQRPACQVEASSR